MAQGSTISLESKIVSHYTEGNRNSKKLFERASDIIPNGVSRGLLYYRPFPIYSKRANRSRLWDLDNNERIDYCFNYSSLILGHNNEKVNATISKQLKNETALGQGNELEFRLAATLKKRVACAESVKFTISGTDAVVNAIRAARSISKNNKVICFERAYHGSSDYVSNTKLAFSSEGTIKQTPDQQVVLPFNDIETFNRTIASLRNEIAGVLVEPVPCAGGLTLPNPEFLKELRESCDKLGVILIFDEVITGFRIAFGGAQEYFRVVPDLSTLGKNLTGGLPGAAVAGKKELMEYAFSNDGERKARVPLSGTYNAHPLSLAAGLATLEQLTPAAYDKLHNISLAITDAIGKAVADPSQRSDSVEFKKIESLFQIFVNKKVRRPSAYSTSELFHLACLNHGIYLPLDHFCCSSLATTTEDIFLTETAVRAALSDVKDSLVGDENVSLSR